MKKRYKILIIGATGFIGKRLATMLPPYFNPQETLCLIWDKDNKLESVGREVLKKVHLKTKRVDLVTGKGLNDIPQSPSVVIHMAATTDTSDPDHSCNDQGTKNLIRSLGNLGPNTHVIFTSTLVLYSGRRDCAKPLSESTKPAPSNEYGRSKLRAEKWLMKECKKKKFRLTILRFNTVYGPNPKPNTLFKILKDMVKKDSVLSKLNWPGLSGVIYVDDISEAILQLAKTKPEPGKPELIIINPESLTFAQMSQVVHKALKIKYRPLNLPELFWRVAKYLRNHSAKLEKITSPEIYSWIWRASLISDDVIHTNTDKVYQFLPNWKPKKLKEVIGKII